MRLSEEFTSIQCALTRDGLLDEVLRFTRWLGFEKVNAMVVLDRFHGEPKFLGVDNTPAAYCEVADSKEIMRRDPVMQHCKRNSVPITWNQGTYIEAGRAEQWEIQAQFGYRSGIALALHLPESRHFFVGVDRDQALPKSPVEMTRLVASLQLFAAYAQDAAFKVLVPASSKDDEPNLTLRELESLRWTMEGKTAWEIGQILSISEQTAVRHLNNATHKLDAVNKHHAVVKALRWGIIR